MKETKEHIDFRAMSREEIETYAVSSKGVPIIDYFSHMGYKYDILAENM